MKAVAAGIVNPDNQKRALQDVDQLKKYAQAGDVSVNKKDGPGFVAVVDKMQELVNDFFDSLSDVPDEIWRTISAIATISFIRFCYS